MGKLKKYGFFTNEQQRAYEGLTNQQRKYIDYRVQGNNKTDAYMMTGYKGTKAGQASYMMEKRNPIIGELIDVVLKHQEMDNFVTNDKGNLNKLIDAKANQAGIETAIEKIEGADSEEAKRIKFYRDIVKGAVKSTKTTKKYDKDGNCIGWTKVTENDVKLRMEAQKELDRLLGLNTVVDLERFKVGAISVQIVDASYKPEVEKKKIDIDDLDYTEDEDIECEPVIEGEEDE